MPFALAGSVATSGLFSAASSTTISLTGVSSGEIIVVWGWHEGATTAYTSITVTDNAGGGGGSSYTNATCDTNGHRSTALAAAFSPAGTGSVAITVTFNGGSGGAYGQYSAARFTVPGGATIAFDSPVHASQTGFSGPNVTVTAAAAGATADELYLAAISIGDNNNPTTISDPPTTSWTSGGVNLNDSSNAGGECAYKIDTSSTTESAAWNTNGSLVSGSVASIWGIKATGGGGGGPSISGTSSATPRNGDWLTITGISFGASPGSVTIGGITQTVLSWAASSIVVKVDRGTNKYGASVNVVVTDTTPTASSPYALTSLQPQYGWGFVDIGTPAGSGVLPASPAIASTDQVAYYLEDGLVSVGTDGVPAVTGSGYVPLAYEVWSSGSGWGSAATLVIFATSTANTGDGTKGGAFGLTGWLGLGRRRGGSAARLLWEPINAGRADAFTSMQIWSDWVFQSTAASGAFTASVAETGTAADTTSSAMAATSTVAETGAASDTTSGAAAAAATVAETGTGADTTSAVTGLFATVAETGTGADTTSASMAAASTVAETGSGAETTSAAMAASATVAETGSAAETTDAVAAGNYLASQAETGAAGDTTSAAAAMSATVPETGSAADTTSASAAGNYLASLLETVSAIETTGATATMTAAQAEVLAALDTVTASFQALAQVVEAAAAADTSSGVFGRQVSTTEVLAASETITALFAALSFVIENDAVWLVPARARVALVPRRNTVADVKGA